jgi:Ino eighty subunit 1
LESDFSPQAAETNPFGPGQFGPADDPATANNPFKCPPFDILSPEAEALENVDTVDEKNFGEIKRKERIAILASDMAPVVTGPKRTNKKGGWSIPFHGDRRARNSLVTAVLFA